MKINVIKKSESNQLQNCTIYLANENQNKKYIGKFEKHF